MPYPELPKPNGLLGLRRAGPTSMDLVYLDSSNGYYSKGTKPLIIPSNYRHSMWVHIPTTHQISLASWFELDGVQCSQLEALDSKAAMVTTMPCRIIK